jgi:hypothetical protein
MWYGQTILTGQPPVRAVFLLKPDGAFLSWFTYITGYTVETYGTYTVKAIAPTSGWIFFTPTGSNQAMPLPPETDALTVVDRNTIVLVNGPFTTHLGRGG